MLKRLSGEIAFCYEHAAECRALAKCSKSDSAAYLRLEESWLKLAKSHELIERLTAFEKQRPDGSVDGEALLLAEVLDALLRELVPRGRNGPLERDVAKTLAHAVLMGERDPATLYQQTLAAFRGSPDGKNH